MTVGTLVGERGELGGARGVVVEHADDHQPRLRRNAGDDPGYVGAVAIAV